MSTDIQLAVIGAGPAGLEAALTASEYGVDVVLIDGSPQAGGQYYQQFPEPFEAGSNTKTSVQKEAQLLIHMVESAPIRRLYNTLVWGAFTRPDDPLYTLALYGPDAPAQLRAHAVIIASGAYDFPLPFPGWTLPGVFTAGAAQGLIKNQRVFPGQRVLISGSGPLQLATAAELIHAGVEVAAVLESSQPVWNGLRNLPAAWGQWGRMAEGGEYSYAMLRSRTPYRLGWSVVAAHGDTGVEEAVIARLSPDGHPIPGSQETLAVDTIITGFGLIPNTGLSRMLGCKHIQRQGQTGWIPERDKIFQTTLPGLFVVGDAAGIGGAELARLEGQVAGLAVAQRLQQISDGQLNTAYQRIQPALKRQQRFARFLENVFAPLPGLTAIPDETTVICRCEEVTLGQIREAVHMGARSVNEVKMLTRTGMGNCQGRICELWVARMIQRILDDPTVTLDSLGAFTVRPPLQPLPVSALALAAESNDEP
ncbi:MAG: FAD-dependent oxidoreductase [Chloroflexi bacterium]|nr:FAD-dependent oxidoreductase [Chloroflexota bacterium]